MLTGDNLVFLYSALFIGVLLLIEGLYQLLHDLRHGAGAQINRRLRMLEAGADPSQVLQALRRPRRQDESRLRRLLLLPRLERLITQAGLTAPSTRVLVIMAAVALVAYALLSYTRLNGAPSLLLALLIGTLLPFLYIRRAARKRVDAFGVQLPDAIELIARSLRAGHPLSAAMAVVAQEMADPLGSEFGIAVDEMTYGLDLQDAVVNISERIGHPDMHYVVVAINIQYGTGGNLAEILAGLAKVIRDRFQMFRKARAVSAEGRLSAYFLAVFPMLLAAALWLINPGYYGRVSDEPLFVFFIGLTAVLLVSNILVMRWLVNIRV